MRQDPVSREIYDADPVERDCLREEMTQLKQLLASDDGSDRAGPSETILNGHIRHLRKRLKPLGISIRTHWGEGYGLTPEMKKHLRDLIMASKS